MAEIVIAINENGQIGMKVSNDIAPQLPIVLGLLEVAKVTWIEQAKQQQNRVQPVSMLPPGLN